MEKVEHLEAHFVCLTTDEKDRNLNNNAISCKDVVKKKGTCETDKTQLHIVCSWIWRKRWSIIVTTVLLLFMLIMACGGMLISLMVGHDSVSKGYIAQRKQTTQHALSIGKLEKEIGILSKDIKSFRIELTELRKQHQEDINRLETHVTENSKDIVDLTNKTKENGISIEQLQTSNLQLSKKIEALDERLNLTQKQKELLRKTINRLEEDILRNTNKIEEIAKVKTQTPGNTGNSQHRPGSSGQSLLKPHGCLLWITFLSLLACQVMWN